MYYNINSNRDYLKLKRCLGENPRSVLVRNICNNAKVNFIATFGDKQKLVVLPDERSAILFYEDGKFYDKDIFYFGEKDLLFASASIDDETVTDKGGTQTWPITIKDGVISFYELRDTGIQFVKLDD